MGENATSTTVAEPSEQELEKEVKKASEQNRRYIRPSELVAFLLPPPLFALTASSNIIG